MLTLYGTRLHQQQPLPGFGQLPPMTRKALGMLGELTTWRALESAGYRVVNGQVERRGDLQVVDSDGVAYSVEVKTSKRGRDGKFSWNLVRILDERTCTDYRHADVLVLLAVIDEAHVVPFVVPCAQIAQKQVNMRNPLSARSKWARWRQEQPTLSLESLG